jgi:hypothetical protein
LIGLTTNHEHGYWLAKATEKVVYGRPDDSYRNTYLDLMWEFEAAQQGYTPTKIFNNLPELVKAAIEKAHERRLTARRIVSKIKVESPYGEFTMTEHRPLCEKNESSESE